MSNYSDYQLKEFEHISQAHFKTNEMIAAFFRYYILVMALPASTVAAFITLSDGDTSIDRFILWQWPLAALLAVFSLLGFFMMLYITGLRSESKLYARQVNSVREYFRRLEEARGTDAV